MFIGYKTKPHPLVELRNRILRLKENAEERRTNKIHPATQPQLVRADARRTGALRPVRGGNHA